MKTRAIFVFAWLVLVLCPVTVMGQKISISVEHDGGDMVGRNVVFALMEAIRRSALMAMNTDQTVPHIKLHILTMDESLTDTGVSSAIAVSFVYDISDMPMYGLYVTMSMYSCGSNKIDNCAQNILADTATAIEWLRQRAPDFLARCRP
jgi:hypothetical protein